MVERGQRRYHGFVSYSHRGDLALAPALQQALQQLARPWSKRHALSVFRDETGLSVNPALWTSITVALDDSEWFVLMASPESAASEWVGKEISHWIATRGTDRLLPVITAGRWEWDSAAGDLDWSVSDAAHPQLRGVFDAPPNTVDLTWARKETDLSLSNPLFRDSVAQIAAPIHETTDAAIVEEHFRQQRKTRRLVRTATVALASVGLVAIAAGGLAVSSSRDAVRQRDSAVVEARAATAVNLTIRSGSLTGGDRARSILLALESYRLDPAARTEAAIRALLDNDLTGLLHGASGGVTDLALSADGGHLAATDGAGSVHLWNLSTRERLLSTPASGFAGVTWLDESHLVVGDLDGRAFIVDTTTGQADELIDDVLLASDSTSGITRPVITSSEANGRIAAALVDGSIVVLDSSGDSVSTVGADTVTSVAVDLVLTGDGRLVAHHGLARISVWRIDGSEPAALIEPAFPPELSVANGLVVGDLAGGFAINAAETTVTSGLEQTDVGTGAQISSEGCGSVTSFTIVAAATYVGGLEHPVVGTTGGDGLIRAPEEVPAEFAGNPNPDVQELCIQGGTDGGAPLSLTGSVWALAGGDDGLILVGSPSDSILMVRYGAAEQRRDLSIDELLGLGCYIAGRNLTESEWRADLPAVTPEQICAQWPMFHATAAAAPAAEAWVPA